MKQKHPWKDLNCHLLFWAQFFSQICDKIVSLGMIWVITDLGGEKYTPWFLLVGSLPFLLFMPFIPKLVDRLGALKTTYLSDFIRGGLFIVAGLIMLAVPGTFSAGTFSATSSDATSSGTLFSLLVLLMSLNFLSSIGAAYFNTAIFTLPVKMTAPQYVQNLSAIINACFSIANVLGPLMAALFYNWVGLTGLLIINGVSYLLAGGLELFIKLESSPETTSPTLEKTKTRHFALLKENPTIKYMLLNFLLINFFLFPIVLFFPLYAKNILAGNLQAFIALETAMGLGMIVGSMWLSFFKFPGRFCHKLAVSLVLMGIGYLIFTISKTLWLSVIAVFIVGLFLQIINIIVIYLFQSYPPEKDIPVVMTLANFITVSAVPLSMLAIGACLKIFPLVGLAIGCALLTIATTFLVYAVPGIRKVQ